MKLKLSASELLDRLRVNYFGRVDFSNVATMTAPEKVQFVLSQTNRLLVVSYIGMFAGELSEYFWTPDEGYIPVYSNNPLIDAEGNTLSAEQLKAAGLNEEECVIAEMIVRIARFCHLIYHHHVFDLNIIEEGLQNEDEPWVAGFCVENKRLVNFLVHTEYQTLAAHMVYTLYLTEVNRYRRDNEPLPENLKAWEYSWPEDDWRNAKHAHKVVILTLDFLRKLKLHFVEGVLDGMNTECVNIHDVLIVINYYVHYEYNIPDFQQEYVNIAKSVQTGWKKMLPATPFLYNKEQCESLVKKFQKMLNRVAKENNVDLSKTDTGYFDYFAKYEYRALSVDGYKYEH